MTTGIGGDTNGSMEVETPAPPDPQPVPQPPPPPQGKTLIEVFAKEARAGRHIHVTATENLGSKDNG